MQEKARAAMDTLYAHRHKSGLVGRLFDTTSGSVSRGVADSLAVKRRFLGCFSGNASCCDAHFVNALTANAANDLQHVHLPHPHSRTDCTIGAGIDSYYEYLLKGYIALGDPELLRMFETHYAAIMQHTKRGSFFAEVDGHDPRILRRPHIDSLMAFWPGVQVLQTSFEWFGSVDPCIPVGRISKAWLKHRRPAVEICTSDFAGNPRNFECRQSPNPKRTFQEKLLLQAFSLCVDCTWCTHSGHSKSLLNIPSYATQVLYGDVEGALESWELLYQIARRNHGFIPEV